MSDIKIVDWPKRPAEQRRDELERENAELRKLLKRLGELVAARYDIWGSEADQPIGIAAMEALNACKS